MKPGKLTTYTIERERGETYSHATYAVYEHGVYPPHSVLAGQPSRRYVDGGFVDAADAKAKYPLARVIDGTTHVPIATRVAHLPDDTDY